MPPIEATVSATYVNRRFSEILRKVRGGGSVTVTSHGKPVARIVPISAHRGTSTGAKAALLARLRAAPVATIGPWSRDELYEDR